MIQFTCPHCNTITEVAPHYAGQSGPCASCGQTITIPGGAPTIGEYRESDIGQDAGMRMLLPVGRSVWAIAAGYLGLLSLIPFVAPFAVIVSIIAIIQLRRNPKLHGMGRAIFGLVMGIPITILTLFCFLGVLLGLAGSGMH